MKHIKTILFAAVLAALAPQLFAETITIVPFAYQGVSQGDAETFTEMFVSEYASITNDDVADRSNFDGIAEQHKFQLTDWSNNDKIAKLGKAMNAQKIICGRISVFGYAVTFTGRVLDVNSTKVLNSVNWKGESLEALLFDITNVAKQLAGAYYIGGKGPGGGIIFYESEAGFSVQEADGTTTTCHYLEVSPTELGSVSWCWCGYYACSIQTLEGVGDGKLNSQKIVDAHKDITAQECAAKLCLEYSTGTTKPGEWYLPSKIELNLIYETLRKSGKIVSDAWHWSSSQGNSYYAWVQRFSDGSQGYGYSYSYSDKGSNSCVRAVRAF